LRHYKGDYEGISWRFYFFSAQEWAQTRARSVEEWDKNQGRKQIEQEEREDGRTHGNEQEKMVGDQIGHLCRNKTGPKTLPWGTPASIGRG